MNQKQGIALAFCFALAAGLAQAGVDRSIASADQNGDGKVTKKELMDVRAWTFDQIDVNKDGVISQREARGLVNINMIEPGRQSIMEFMRQRDLNRDGQISKEEYTFVEVLYKTADSNGDGALVQQEVDEVVARFGAFSLR